MSNLKQLHKLPRDEKMVISSSILSNGYPSAGESEEFTNHLSNLKLSDIKSSSSMLLRSDNKSFIFLFNLKIKFF